MVSWVDRGCERHTDLLCSAMQMAAQICWQRRVEFAILYTRSELHGMWSLLQL
jgi:hypothetical protein